MKKFIYTVAEILLLDHYFDIVLSSKSVDDADAIYETHLRKSKVYKHKITVYLGNYSGRSLEALIAHELIHAWQAENDYQDIHGESFIKTARYLTRELSKWGYEVPGIYIPDLDVT